MISTEKIKKEISIIDLVKNYGVKKLKQLNNSEYLALCPFHDDHNPSLSINEEKGIFHCFACNEKGDIFNFVEKIENINFSEAKKKIEKIIYGNTNNTEKKVEPPILNRIIEYYHQTLLDTEYAKKYLEKRGFNIEKYKKFQLGYADGSIIYKIRKENKQKFKNLGILNKNGSEIFYNCIIFPIFDDNNHVVSIYGRNVDDNAKIPHLYLKGKHKGVFNHEIFKFQKEIIITESIIDALSLIEIGFENVTACYGINGFTDDHLSAFEKNNVKNIIIAYDNDKAGKDASIKLKDKLTKKRFKVKIITPQNLKDWNNALMKGVQKKDIDQIIWEQHVDELSKKCSNNEELNFNIIEKENCMMKMIKTGEKKISNFVIEPKEIINVIEQKKSYINGKIKSKKTEHKIIFPISAFSSSKNLIEALEFNMNYSFFGNNEDAQNIKQLLAGKSHVEKKGTEIAGVHFIENEWIYIEEKKDNEKSKLVLLPHNYHQSDLFQQSEITKNQVEEILKYLFVFNSPDVVFPLLGFCFVCIVKERLFQYTHKNPLLFGSGQKESGKTSTLELVKKIFAIKSDIENIGAPTKFMFAKALSSTNMSPIIYDEYKPIQLNLFQQKLISEMIRASYNQSSFTRGRKDLSFVRIQCCAPVIITGEMEISEGALKDRVIPIYFSKRKSSGMENNFNSLMELPIASLTRNFSEWCLTKNDDYIINEYQLQLSRVDKKIKYRKRENTAYVRLGIQLLYQYLYEKWNINIDEDEKKKNFNTIDLNQKETLKESNKNIVDDMLEIIFAMINDKTLGDEHYFYKEKTINFHMKSIFFKLTKWLREHNWQIEMLDKNSFMKQVRETIYFLNYKNIWFPSCQKDKKAIVLDIEKIKEVGIEIE